MANILRINDFLPSKFCGMQGQDPKSHFLSFHDYANVHGLDPDNLDQLIIRFKHTLEGPTRLWVEGKNFENINDLQTSFMRYFSGIHSREANARNFCSLENKQGVSIEDYASKICNAAEQLGSAEQLGYSDDLIRDQFLRGLPGTLQVQLSLTGAQNLGQLTEFAQKYMDLTNFGSVSWGDQACAASSAQGQIHSLSE